MPADVDVAVREGFAFIDFKTAAAKGAGIARLLEVGGPATIETLTRTGPRRLYVVPEGNAREAGLLDADSAEIVFPDTSSFTDASGFVAPSEPSTLDLHAQDVRGGQLRTDTADTTPAPVSAPEVQGYDDGQPDMDWSRKAIDDYAANLGIDTTAAKNKHEAIDLIQAAQQPE